MKAFNFSKLCSIACLMAVTVAQPSVYVPRLDATYEGKTNENVDHFLHVKYGHDTGKQRFSPPEPFLPDAGAKLDASLPGPACPQMREPIPPAFDETLEISEDCLHLRIARPAGTASDSKLPVVIWLYGGGIIKGSMYDSHFVPDNLIELSIQDGKPMIYVAINSRMTIFGYPSLPNLKEQKSMNLGLRDQRLAFQWLKDNIEAFGGDPERLTVYGLSAGGTLASLHTMAFGGSDGVPFQQIWAMSGPPGTSLNMTTDAGTTHTREVAKRLDCEDSDDDRILQCLRDVPMQQLVDITMAFSRENHPPAGLFTFIPTVDEDFFPERPTKLVKSGRFAKGIRMIHGWTQDDGAMNVGPFHLVQSEEDMIAPIKNFARLLTPKDYDFLFFLYPAEAFEFELQNYNARKAETDPSVSVHFFRVSRILRDILFTCSSIKFSYEMTKQSSLLDPTFGGTRVYDLNQSVYNPMLSAMGMPFLGTIHGSDQVYITNGVFPEGEMTETDKQLAERMSRSLINFAHSGDTIAGDTSTMQFEEWPISFGPNVVDDRSVFTSGLSIQIIGGPLGTGPIELAAEEPFILDDGDHLQQVLQDDVKYGRMETSTERERQKLVESEYLLERYDFIYSLSERLGT